MARRKSRDGGTTLSRRVSSLCTDAKALSEHLGVSLQAISQYCSGTSRPTIENLGKIADFYGVSIDYLIGRTNVRPNDADLQSAVKYTGLSEDSLKKLHDLEADGTIIGTAESYYGIISQLLLSDYFYRSISQLGFMLEYAKKIVKPKVDAGEKIENVPNIHISMGNAVNYMDMALYKLKWWDD